MRYKINVVVAIAISALVCMPAYGCESPRGAAPTGWVIGVVDNVTAETDEKAGILSRIDLTVFYSREELPENIQLCMFGGSILSGDSTDSYLDRAHEPDSALLTVSDQYGERTFATPVTSTVFVSYAEIDGEYWVVDARIVFWETINYPSWAQTPAEKVEFLTDKDAEMKTAFESHELDILVETVAILVTDQIMMIETPDSNDRIRQRPIVDDSGEEHYLESQYHENSRWLHFRDVILKDSNHREVLMSHIIDTDEMIDQ